MIYDALVACSLILDICDDLLSQKACKAVLGVLFAKVRRCDRVDRVTLNLTFSHEKIISLPNII